MIVSAWTDGHGTYGVRVLDREVSLWFRPEWQRVQLELPDRSAPIDITLTESFWSGSPELRSPEIREFFRRHDILEWQRLQPPRFELEPLGGGSFRLKWLHRVEGQQALPLDL